MDREELWQVVLAVVKAHAPAHPADVAADAPLGPDGLGIDSIGCLDIVLELERQTGIALRDEGLTAQTLSTPATLLEHLLRERRSHDG